MGGGTDPDVPNPYAAQTTQNENTPWLAETVPVDVHLSGLQEYAKKMVAGRDDLMSRQGHLMHLSSMPMQAWEGKTLGEAAFVRSQMMANASELTSYLGVLGQTLFNIGCAAQTIADIYNSTDGTSAATLNDVAFAFADPNASRPSGLAKNIGQTYDEAIVEAQMSKHVPASSPIWPAGKTTYDSPYKTVLTSTLGDGQRKEVITTSTPYGYGPTVVTTLTYDAKGHVVSSTSVQTSYGYDTATNTSTKTVTSSKGDEVTGKTVTATTYGSDGEVTKETVANTDGENNPTGGSTKTVVDGVETDVTTKTDKTGTHETDKVVVGPATEGGQSYPKPISTEYDRPSPGL